ncbi:hypothetical protein FQN57_004346 [Myotisia sp. PD_48]|nr:hypothetical protein FQN57_004346 [Myotisia sp. PD_48]
MPSIVRQSELPAFARLPSAEELYVMERYAKHASRCNICYLPYQTVSRGEALCARGMHLASEVTQYIQSKNGKPYGVTEYDVPAKQIAIPGPCEVVRDLLRAFDLGLANHLRKARTHVIVHNDQYTEPSSPRSTASVLSSVPSSRSYYDELERPVIIQPARRTHRDSYGHREDVYIPTRGSLYRQSGTQSRGGVETYHAGPRSRTQQGFLR